MRRLIVAAVFPLLSLSACNSTAEQRAEFTAGKTRGEIAREKASPLIHADMECLTKHAVTLDDGISSADVIAQAAASSCDSGHRQVVATLFPDGVRPAIAREMQTLRIERAMKTVLVHRTRKR